MRFDLQPLGPAHHAACARILEDLPEWFGLEAARQQYIADLPASEGVAATAEGGVQGFLVLRRHSPYAAEIHLLAVARTAHRQGVGRALVTHAEAQLRAEAVEYLSVKTLGPSDPDEFYAATRAFYTAVGFRPLEETTAFWGEENPCLLMIKRL